MKTTIEHKYNIGDSHFDFAVNSNQSVAEFKIISLLVNADGVKYIVNRSPDTSFARETKLSEEEICPTIDAWVEKKTAEYKENIKNIAYEENN
jgi:hypothetical protein